MAYPRDHHPCLATVPLPNFCYVRATPLCSGRALRAFRSRRLSSFPHMHCDAAQRCNRGNLAYSRPSRPRRYPYDRVLLPKTPSCPRDCAQFFVNLIPSRRDPPELNPGKRATWAPPSSRARLSLCPFVFDPALACADPPVPVLTLIPLCHLSRRGSV